MWAAQDQLNRLHAARPGNISTRWPSIEQWHSFFSPRLQPVRACVGVARRDFFAASKNNPRGKTAQSLPQSAKCALQRACEPTDPTTEARAGATTLFRLQKSNPRFLQLTRNCALFFSANELQTRSESGANRSFNWSQNRNKLRLVYMWRLFFSFKAALELYEMLKLFDHYKSTYAILHDRSTI